MGIPQTQLSLLRVPLNLEEKNKTDPRWVFRPVGVLHKRSLGLLKHGLLKRVRVVDGLDEFELTSAGRKMALREKSKN